MVRFNARQAGLSVLTGLALSLSSCATRDAAPPPPAAEAAAEKPSKPACYPRYRAAGSDDWYLDYVDETECYRFGVCDSETGDAEGTGQCHKWAMGPDEPALPWSERLTNPELGASIPPPEDLYEGSGEMTSDFCIEDCPPVMVRLSGDTPLHESPDRRSAVIANLPATECLEVREYKLLSTPQRGVVTAPASGFAAGDVIYYLSYQGEGSYFAWWRGGYTYGEYDVPQVEWDPPPETPDPRAGFWRQLVRADGTSGWALDPELTDYGSCSPPAN